MTTNSLSLIDCKDLLTIPGSGIYTVSTGSSWKEKLWTSYYGSTNKNDITSVWNENLNNLLNSPTSKSFLLALPNDSGSGILRGSNWGPLFIRLALLKSYHDLKENDLGDIIVNPHLLFDEYLKEEWIKNIQKKLYPNSKGSLPVSPLSQLDTLTLALWKQFPKRKLLTLGGDHSCSYPLVKNWILTRTHSQIAVIHFDAHTDLLEERLGIPYCFGSWAHHILQYLPSAKHLIQLGLRASSKDQKYWEEKKGVKQFWSKDIKKQSTETTLSLISKHLEDLKVKEIYISFDVDVLDPSFLSCTGTCEPEGLFPHHISEIIKMLKSKFLISAMDIVEYAPFIRAQDLPQSQMEPETSQLTLIKLMPIFWECLR